MAVRQSFDSIDAALLRALIANSRAPIMGLADQIGVSRNTVQAHLSKLDAIGALRTFDRCVDPGFLGYPLRAYIWTRVEQRQLDAVSAELNDVPEVIAVDGLSGDDDLLVQVVARDADDLYRIAGQILSIDGVERTRTSLVMRELVEYRIAQLIGTSVESAQLPADSGPTGELHVRRRIR